MSSKNETDHSDPKNVDPLVEMEAMMITKIAKQMAKVPREINQSEAMITAGTIQEANVLLQQDKVDLEFDMLELELDKLRAIAPGSAALTQEAILVVKLQKDKVELELEKLRQMGAMASASKTQIAKAKVEEYKLDAMVAAAKAIQKTKVELENDKLLEQLNQLNATTSADATTKKPLVENNSAPNAPKTAPVRRSSRGKGSSSVLTEKSSNS